MRNSKGYVRNSKGCPTNQERMALLTLAAQIETEEHFCPLCIRQNKSFFILCCSAFTILTIGIILIIIRVPEVRPNLPTDILLPSEVLLNGWVTRGHKQVLDQLRVNLDDPPEERWAAIGRKYRHLGQNITETVSVLRKSASYSKLSEISSGSNLDNFILNHTGRSSLLEIKGYAKYLNVSYEDLIIFNLLHPYNMHNDISIVPDDQGHVWQRVYLANPVTSHLPKFHTEVDFYLAGKLVYKTVTGIGLIGAPLGVRFNGFTISVSLKNISDENPELQSESAFVSSWAVRQVLHKSHSYGEAMKHLRNLNYAGNFVLGGLTPKEVIIVKNTFHQDPVLSSEVIHKQNPVYTIQMTASHPARFQAFCWTFN